MTASDFSKKRLWPTRISKIRDLSLLSTSERLLTLSLIGLSLEEPMHAAFEARH